MDRNTVLTLGQTYAAEDHTTKGFAHRVGWHCTLAPFAPHLKMKLANGEERVWAQVRLSGDVQRIKRPAAQGGTWLLAEGMEIVYIRV